MKNKTLFQQGFGLVEILISLLLAAFFSMGAYRFLGLSAQSTNASLQTSDEKNDLELTMDFVAGKLRNAVTLRGGASSLFQNIVDAKCSDSLVATSILAYPATYAEGLKDKGALPVASSIPISSQDVGVSDAMRFIYYPQDSQELPLAIDVTTGKFFPTEGNVPIVVSDKGTLEPGDYALIYDELSTDFFRVTGIEAGSNGKFLIFHAHEKSVWNIDFAENYGLSEKGNLLSKGAFIRKISPFTLAHSQERQQVYMDDHLADDGFSPENSSFMGPRGYGYRYKTLLDQVTNFQIFYSESDESAMWLRTPRAGEFGRKNKEDVDQGAKCGNQLGHPYLEQIRFDLTYAKKSYSRRVSMSSLQHSAASPEDLIGKQPPVPTPTPTPCPNGFTTTYTNAPVPQPYVLACVTNTASCSQSCTYVPVEVTATPTWTPPPTATPVFTPPTGGGGSF